MNPPMRRVDWNQLDAVARDRVLTRSVNATAADVATGVAGVLADVRRDGDAALRALTRRFDGVEVDAFAVGRAEFDAADAVVDPALRHAVVRAASRIERFHRAGMARPVEVETAPGVRCGRMLRPIPRIGLYVPAGMSIATARGPVVPGGTWARFAGTAGVRGRRDARCRAVRAVLATGRLAPA